MILNCSINSTKKNIEFPKDNKTKLTLLGSSSSEISVNY